MDKSDEKKLGLAVDILKAMAKHNALPPPLAEQMRLARDMAEMRMSIEKRMDPGRFEKEPDKHELMYWTLQGNVDIINAELGYTAFEVVDKGRPNGKKMETDPANRPDKGDTDAK